MSAARSATTGTHRGTGRSLRRIICALLVIARSVVPLFADLPRIERLDRSDPVYAQQQAAMQAFYLNSARGEPLPELVLYDYPLQSGDTLFAIAARLSVPYSAIATLNNMVGPELGDRESLTLPNIPGIFVPLDPSNDLQLVMHSLRSGTESVVRMVPAHDTERPYRFYPGEDFLPDERRSFLGLLFRHPLPKGRLTSPFGPRTNPVTLNWVFHNGVDFAAPAGTPVLAARGGVVTRVGTDPVLGIYVRLRHSGGFETAYGHLAEARVTLNQEVASGMIIGSVGTTGMTTGYHLHFEIVQGGRHRDPLPMLP